MADRIKNYQQAADELTILKDIRSDLVVTPSSYTPDTSTVTRDRVATFAQAEEANVVLGDIQTGMKQFVADTKFGIGANAGDIANIKALLQGHLYDYQTDSTSAYIKSVPVGAMPYASLDSIGGKTIVYNQILPNTSSRTEWEAYASANLTLSFNDNVLNATINISGSGGYTVGVRTGRASYPIYQIIAGHKYYLSYTVKSDMACAFGDEITGESRNVLTILNVDTWYKYEAIRTPQSYEAGRKTGLMRPVGIEGANLQGMTYSVKEPILIDLTLMFGSGNEPSTVEEFQQMFPAYYPYNKGELLSAGVTEVVSKDTNNATLQTYSIPAEVKALEGYGWSAGTAYNYIDLERKVFVQNVGSRAYASGDESDSTVITDGTTTYYPLTTAVETDISEYITDDNLIEVEAGGTLTFENQHGDDYQIPVPSTEEYMIDLQEAINNG